MDEKRFRELNETFERVKTKSNRFSPQVKGKMVELFAGVLDGELSIAITGMEEELTLKSTSLIRVVKRSVHETPALIFSLTNSDLLDIFISFALDMETMIQEKKDISWTEIYNRYLYWQKMFKVERVSVSESVVKGLINELYILKTKLIPKYGESKAMRGWIGTRGDAKDFSYDDCWYEVKAISKGKEVVEIATLAQLEATTQGQLLVSFFEKTSMDNKNGIRLFELLKEIEAKVKAEDEIADFYNKIIETGIDMTVFSDENHEANEFCYIIHEIASYFVNDDFPRLTKGNLPLAVGKVKYELILAQIEEYRQAFY